MKKIVNREEERQKKEKKKESILLVMGTLLPLVIGFSLVYFVQRGAFRIIGWVLLIFGIFGGFFYFRRIYLKHKDAIKRLLRGRFVAVLYSFF